jgi:DNA-binding NarL/FixJ family response regulator
MRRSSEPIWSFSRLKALMESQPGFAVTNTFDNGMDAISEFNSENQDIVLMDISMPTINGFETSARLIEIAPDS